MDQDEPPELVSIEASLTESGVALNARSRFVSAIDRLFGGIFSLPATHLEARAARTRLSADLDRQRMRQKAELQLAGELKLEQLGLAAAYISQERETKRLLNLASVAAFALEDLREGQSERASDENFEGDISDDWLNWFESCAEKATADHVRQLWGKILARESRKPGSFSLSTLRVVSETDQRLAELFQKHVCNVFDGKFLLKDDEDTKGEELLELSALEDAGYLREVSGMLNFTWNFNDEGKFVHRAGNLVFVAEGPAGHQIQVAIILISRAGLDLLTVLPQIPQDGAFRQLATLMPPVTTSIKLGVVLSETGPGQINWMQTEVLKAPQPPATE